MTDLEKTYMCAEKMGYAVELLHRNHGAMSAYWSHKVNGQEYCPLTDGAEAMALLEKFKLKITWHYGENVVRAIYTNVTPDIDSGYQPNLKRAIVECVSKIHPRGADE